MASSAATTDANPKIIDLIGKAKDDGKPYVSLEYFPPRTAEGVKNLHARMDRMKKTVQPIFSDVTWGAGGSTAGLTMELAKYMHDTGHVSNMHMTCTNISGETNPKQAVLNALTEAYEGGIRNIVALRGDPPAGQTEWTAAEGGFTCGLDLVQFIRSQDHPMAKGYGISVAGYPEGHPTAISEVEDPSTLTEAEKGRSSEFDGKTYCCRDADYQKELEYLKKKVDAGGDFIITQMFFDVPVFETFVVDCRKAGINCPIVPGLMCINAYAGFCKMTKFCKTRVPTDLRDHLETIKGDADAVKKFGIEFGTKQCRQLIDSERAQIRVLHFYTLNLEKVVYGILDNLGLTENAAAGTNEADAASQVATGSAWARVGDRVKVEGQGEGVVVELNQQDGSAKVQLDSNKDGEPVAAAKGQYTKIFG